MDLEIYPTPTPPATPPTPETERVTFGRTISCNFQNEAIKKRFEKVYNARLKKGKTHTVSEFIHQLFLYVEHNPYGDFYTGN